MATTIRAWSSTAASNGAADSNVNWAEGQAPSTVNDSARYMMKEVADWLASIGYGTLSAGTVGGTASAITITSPTGNVTAARTAGLRYLFAFGSAITGATTLAVDGLTAGAIQFRGAALIANDYASGEVVLVEDDATNYQIIGPAPRLSAGATDWTTDTTGGDVADLFVFSDASQNGAINKVTAQKMMDNLLAALTAKATPVPADYLMIADSAASNIAKTATLTAFFQAIIGLTAKATPVVADTILLSDSAASNAAKRATITQFLTAVAAAQSDQETATSVVLPVTPGRQHFHPSAAKFFVKFDTSAAILGTAYNVSGIVRNSSGNYTVSFATSFSSANYVASGNAAATSGEKIVVCDSQGTGSIVIKVLNGSGNPTETNVTSIMVTGFGDFS